MAPGWLSFYVHSNTEAQTQNLKYRMHSPTQYWSAKRKGQFDLPVTVQDKTFNLFYILLIKNNAFVSYCTSKLKGAFQCSSNLMVPGKFLHRPQFLASITRTTGHTVA